MAIEPQEDVVLNRESQARLGEPETADRRVIGRPFEPGNNANPYGRKGDPAKRTAMSELRRLADKNATPLARALVKNALSGNVRAWVAMADRAYGVPKQSLEISRADDPLVRWLSGMGTIDTPIDVVNDLPALPPPSTD